jgi:hypothetical protein
MKKLLHLDKVRPIQASEGDETIIREEDDRLRTSIGRH